MKRKSAFLRNVLALLGGLAGIAILALSPWWLLLAIVLLLTLWLAFTPRGRQAWSMTQVGMATIPQRLGASSVVIVGIAGVVGVLVALLAMAKGFEATLRQTGNDETAIVIRAGAQTELNSVLARESALLVAQQPQVLKDGQGRPIASPELVVVASLPKKSNGLDANVEIRGVGEQVLTLRPEVKLISGRMFKPGLHELIVGKGAREQFVGLDVGSTLSLGEQDWTIVGEFDSGDARNSEVWGDAQVIASAYRRGSSVTSVSVRLTGPEAFDAFRAALASDPRLKVETLTTRDYYNRQSEDMTRFIHILGIVIGVIMALGALFGAVNTMYAAVAARVREIATLRAIGFRGAPVTISVLLETLLLALLGGVIGGGIAWLIFDNYAVSTLGSNFTQVVFAFRVDAALLGAGLKWALAIGLAGGLFPALRAATVPVTSGLREL